MSLDPLGTSTAHFQRSALDNIGLDPKARETLETLPLNQDAIVAAIDETRVELNTVEKAPFLLFDADAGEKLTDTRLLTGSDNVTFDVGPAEAVLDLSDTPVVPTVYGAADRLVVLSIDRKGRITGAAEIVLNSDNVHEGTTHLFYTDARARAALSDGTGIDYNSGTGVIALDTVGGVAGTYAPPTSITVDNYGRITAIA